MYTLFSYVAERSRVKVVTRECVELEF